MLEHFHVRIDEYLLLKLLQREDGWVDNGLDLVGLDGTVLYHVRTTEYSEPEQDVEMQSLPGVL